jgi:hypothetical protein
VICHLHVELVHRILDRSGGGALRCGRRRACRVLSGRRTAGRGGLGGGGRGVSASPMSPSANHERSRFCPRLAPELGRKAPRRGHWDGASSQGIPELPTDGCFSLFPGCWSRNRSWAIRFRLLLMSGRSDPSLVQVFGDAHLLCLSARPHMERDTYDDFRAEGYPYDQKD